MQTPHTHQPLNFKKGRRLGDLSLLYGIKHSPVWKLLFFNLGKGLWIIFTQGAQSISVVYAYLYTAVIRCQHGILVNGIVLTFIGVGFILAFNSPLVWTALSPLAAFVVPILPFIKDRDTLYAWGMVDVHSRALLIYAGVFTLLSLLHTLLSWMGYGHPNATQRGISYLYLLMNYLLSKYTKVSLFFVHFVEALSVVSVGVYLWVKAIDPYFGGFLVVIASNELISLLIEKSRQAHTKVLMEA